MCLLLASTWVKAQNGLERIIVEKYYVSNASDAAGSIGTLPSGSVTYRIYADMLPNYKFQAAYGVPTHELRLTTSTTFFNNEDRGATTPTYTKTQARANTVMLDSWLSVGAACAANFGVLKSEDNVASGGATVVNSNVPPILQNNDPSAGVALTVHDGLWTGTPEAVTFVGISATDLAALDATSQAGNSFITSNGSWAALNGATGITSSNTVLIAQITTDGVFNYELNIQIGTPTGGTQNFVARNPVGAEISIPSLMGTLGATNTLPTCLITAPANGSSALTGSTVALSANATDADGTIAQVEFFVNGTSVGVDNTAPYAVNYVASTPGSKSITAVATDNSGGSTTSTAVTINVASNNPPVVTLTAPSNGSTVVAPAPVTISATASDPDGTISQVEFFVNGVSVGVDNTSPYSVSWVSVIGSATITAVARDNQSANTTSAPVTITVFDPNGAPYRINSSATNCFQNVLCIPLTATSTVTNVIGYDVVLKYNKAKVTPTGTITVGSSMINPSFTSTATSIDTANGRMSISVFFSPAAPSGTFFTGTGDVFCTEFIKTTSFAAVDTAWFAVVSLQESRFTGVTQQLADSGSYRSFKDSAFAASLRFWYDLTPIRYDASNPASNLPTDIVGNSAACNTPSAVSVRPDMSGNFIYNINNGSNININKDIPGTNSVQSAVNGFDAFLASKVLLGDASFVPNIYQILAMDVNLDGVISAGDISQMNQRTVLAIPEYRQAWNYNASGTSNGQPSKDWTFIDGATLGTNPAYRISATYPANDGVGFSKFRVPVVPFCLQVPLSGSAACQLVGTETYKGILIGDVNGNWSTSAGLSTLRSSAAGNIVFDLTNAVVNGGFIDIPVFIDASSTINAMDFSLTFDENVLSYVNVINNTSYIQALANYSAADNTLRFTSYSLQDYDVNTPLVMVRFAITGSVDPTQFNFVEAYLNGDPATVLIQNSTSIGSVSNASEMVVVFPNPARELFNVLVSEPSSIEVLDISGRSLLLQRIVDAGQRFEINTASFAAGVYLVRISNEKFVTTKQIAVQK